MKRSTDRILTTHAGSLHRPPDLLAMIQARQAGTGFDAAAFDARLKTAVEEAVRLQVENGVDIVSDGEYSKVSFAMYVLDRIDGFGGDNPTPRHFADRDDFPEYAAPVGDGLPETLGDWIRRDGLTHLKVKLNGDDLGWDVDRVVRVNAVAEEAGPDRSWHYSLDFNERCRDVQYLLDFLATLKERSPAAFGRVQYVEQPTARDLRANPQNRMHKAAEIVPVVIDESLIDVESLHLAREMGYTGVAFKACKGQTQTLLLAAVTQKLGLFRCVQDLTCPGASLIHSAGIAAHIPGVAAIESNGRQYCPAANAAWDARFPGVFTVRDGAMNTGLLTGPWLGAV